MTHTTKSLPRRQNLASYRTDKGEQRLLIAVPAPGDDGAVTVIDVLGHPADADSREVEPRVDSLAEAQAIANDYATKAAELGWPLMPTPWW